MELKNTFEDSILKALSHLWLIILSVMCVVPFLIIISASISSSESFALNGYTILPTEFNLDSFKYVFMEPGQILSAYGVTILVTVVGTVGGMFLMTTLAYVISRDDFKLKGPLSFFVYFTMLFNGGMVANYMWIAKSLNMYDTIWALILPLMMNASHVLILRMFCKSIPSALIESAKIEGAGEIRIFFTIVLPLAKTGIATIALLTIFNYWNNWYNSMLYVDSGAYTTIQYYLVRVLNSIQFAKNSASSGMVSGMEVPDEGIRMCICLIAAGPMVVIFPFFQKYFAKGVVMGSVKG